VNIKYISMGKEQGDLIEKMINMSKSEGNWVILENVHLLKSHSLLKLIEIIEELDLPID
jgi:hypothetical protein